MAEFIAAAPYVLCVVVCFSFRVSFACQGRDLVEIAGVLKFVSDWEKLAGWLNVDNGVVVEIGTYCRTQGSISAACHMMNLIKHYCEKTARSPRQVADDMADVLETRMDIKLQADKLRKLKLTGSAGSPSADRHLPLPSDSTTHHSPSHSQKPSSQPTTGPSTGPAITDTVVGLLEGYWVSIGVALALVAVTTCIYRIYTRPGPLPGVPPPEVRTARVPPPGVPPVGEPPPGVRTAAHTIIIDLGIDDLHTVLEEVVDIKKKWKALGLQLGLKEPTLEGIEADKRDVADCKMEMLSKWLKHVENSKPSWNSLVAALRNVLVEGSDIADAIEAKYSIN